MIDWPRKGSCGHPLEKRETVSPSVWGFEALGLSGKSPIAPRRIRIKLGRLKAPSECVSRNRDHLWVARSVNKRKGCLQQLGQPGHSTSTAKGPYSYCGYLGRWHGPEQSIPTGISPSPPTRQPAMLRVTNDITMLDAAGLLFVNQLSLLHLHLT